ncbi:MAG: outer membrane protein assembly factor [Pseudomonadales bacterium]|nr:outer membrane protein assembly factor [Pseudomonadales bacterium]MCP5189002.1 outer membrane protein assembly factor [Pseudomonadales bacterium]
MWYRLLFCLLIPGLLLPGQAAAKPSEPLLEYHLSGLEGSLKRNALAWLGDPPTSEQARLNFLMTARERVEDSLKALGYYNAEVTTRLQRSEPVWSLDIKVEPGEPVLIGEVNIEVRGAANADPRFRELLASAPFRQGDVFNHGDYQRFRDELLSLGQQRGYFDAELQEHRVAVNAMTNTADISLVYESGPRFRFGQVHYDDTRLEPQLLEAIQPFRPGDYFDQSKLQALQAQLQRTGYFSGVLIRPDFGAVEHDRVPLKVTLHPAKRHSFDVGIGYSTDTQGRVSMVWRTPLVNRYGHSQETRVAYSEVNPGGRFVYSIPLQHPVNDVLHLSALLEDDEYGDIDSRQQEVGALREMRGSRWLHSYSVRALEESWQIKSTQYSKFYTLPGFAFSRSDRSGSVVDPADGFSQFYKVEGGSEYLGSDVDLLRLTANFSFIRTPWPAHRLVARAALGAVFFSGSELSDLAPSLGFFAGGSQSIRGYAYQSIGKEIQVTREDGSPQTLTVAADRLVTGTLEYQYYFTPNWRGAVFVDAGDAFNEGEFDAMFGPGFGIHYISPVGAVRVELANGVSENSGQWRLVVNIGAEF